VQALSWDAGGNSDGGGCGAAGSYCAKTSEIQLKQRAYFRPRRGLMPTELERYSGFLRLFALSFLSARSSL
jgi:hypothetical protein